jgi:hypothetical protein
MIESLPRNTQADGVLIPRGAPSNLRTNRAMMSTAHSHSAASAPKRRNRHLLDKRHFGMNVIWRPTQGRGPYRSQSPQCAIRRSGSLPLGLFCDRTVHVASLLEVLAVLVSRCDAHHTTTAAARSGQANSPTPPQTIGRVIQSAACPSLPGSAWPWPGRR